MCAFDHTERATNARTTRKGATMGLFNVTGLTGIRPDSPQGQRIKELTTELSALLPDPRKFTAEEVADFTDEMAEDVYRAARRQLLFDLLHLEVHEHYFDDCGDDTQSAVEQHAVLWDLLFANDGTDYGKLVKDYLLRHLRQTVDEQDSFAEDIRVRVLPDSLLPEHLQAD